MVKADPIATQVAAISVGIVAATPMVDLDYQEDSQASTDLNLVMSVDGGIVEVQGTAEGDPFSRGELQAMLDLGAGGIEQVIHAQKGALGGTG